MTRHQLLKRATDITKNLAKLFEQTDDPIKRQWLGEALTWMESAHRDLYHSEVELDEAYAELRKQKPAMTAVFDERVHARAELAGLYKGETENAQVHSRQRRGIKLAGPERAGGDYEGPLSQ